MLRDFPDWGLLIARSSTVSGTDKLIILLERQGKLRDQKITTLTWFHSKKLFKAKYLQQVPRQNLLKNVFQHFKYKDNIASLDKGGLDFVIDWERNLQFSISYRATSSNSRKHSLFRKVYKGIKCTDKSFPIKRQIFPMQSPGDLAWFQKVHCKNKRSYGIDDLTYI